jgi:hypothetical protein
MDADQQKDDDLRKSTVEIWKTVVGVQMHFNDIEMRIRSVFITLVLALCASVGFLTDKKPAVLVGGITIYFVALVPLLGVVATYLFYFIDRHWYHRLLVGAVKHAIDIEKRHAAILPELSLSDAIGRESPVPVRSRMVRIVAALVVSDARYRKDRVFHSDAKIEFFYKSIVLLFSLFFIIALLFGGVLIKGLPIIHFFKTWVCSL